MPDPIKPVLKARRALLGLGNIPETPTGNLPSVIPQPSTAMGRIEEKIQQKIEQPIDRRTFLEGSRNALAAASNIDKLGALGDLIPEAVQAVPEVAPRADVIMNALNGFLNYYGESHPYGSFLRDELLPSLDGEWNDRWGSQFDFISDSYKLTPEERTLAEDTLQNSIWHSGNLENIVDDGRPKEAWRSFFEDWDTEPSYDEAIAGKLSDNSPFTVEQLKNLNISIDPEINGRVDSVFNQLWKDDDLLADLYESGWIKPGEEYVPPSDDYRSVEGGYGNIASPYEIMKWFNNDHGNPPEGVKNTPAWADDMRKKYIPR
jgi:hypothetical protein